MFIRTLLALVFLAAALVPAAQGQSQSPSLKDAGRALVDALTRRDKAAFEQLLAPDAVFFLPIATHGADAIVKAWLPFLSDGTQAMTMTLTADEPVIAVSGDLGYATGTFAFKSQASAGPMQSGEYVGVWRVIEGRWKISALGGGAAAGTRPVVRGAVGGYRFGMTRDEVRAASDCQPYTNVSQTGGIECANYTFEGRKMNISFIFAADRLRRIQFWLYEGSSEAGAKEAMARAIEYLRRTAGGVSIGALPGVEVTADRVLDLLNGGAPEPGRVPQFDLSTPAGSQPEVWFARVVRPPGGYLVFLFADPRVP